MARHPRLELPCIPQHVVQRGNNRLPCFLDDGDRQRYLQCLHQAMSRYGVRLHAYALMSNHVHLLLTPGEAGALSRMMHTFGRNYAGLFNGRHRRTGTLWEGRYKACLVGSQSYFLACCRYIELNPVRAWMVAEPDEYPWSSHGANAWGRADALLTPHACYVALGSDACRGWLLYQRCKQARRQMQQSQGQMRPDPGFPHRDDHDPQAAEPVDGDRRGTWV